MKEIGDYGLIGDGQTAALIGRDATIEWLCLPRFDAESCFASLIGTPENGYWRMTPEAPVVECSRHYEDETLILETRFRTERGEVAVIDFMPIRGHAPDVIRVVEGRSGTVSMRSELVPRFDHGRIRPMHERASRTEVYAIAGPNALRLSAEVDIEEWRRAESSGLLSRFEVAAGTSISFVLSWYPSHEHPPDSVDARKTLEDTRAYWRRWAGRCTYDGPHRALVVRSLITLKALIHQPTGGMVAAPTSSLPEQPGGSRNWDYRFCWLRDSTLTLITLLHSGYADEAADWVAWLRRALAGQPVDVRPFYTIDGRAHALEQEAPWLNGFNGAKPVRFGNAAIGQLQLDVYGEVLDTLHVADRHGVASADAVFDLMVTKLEGLWQEPDAGMWESRGEPRQHVYSKVLCWVAFDRAADWFRQDPERSASYRNLADTVRAEVLEHGIDRERNCFTRSYGERALDAATLALPLVGFLPADDPRIVATVAAIEQNLMRDGLVYRYAPGDDYDGLEGGEGAFLACCFWLADVYALQGRQREAEALFERIARHGNDLGLFSEEVSPRDGRLLGNMPQALSHLSLIGTALNLAKTRGPNHERAGAFSEPARKSPGQAEAA